MTGTERLGAADSWFLYLEGPTMHLHVTGVLIADAGTAPEPLDFPRFRHHVASRLGRLPMLRRRIVEVPLGIDHPVSIEVTDLDIDDHLTYLPLTDDPDAAFRQVVDRFCSAPLDRGRPLWEMLYVDGLSGDRCALVAKLHHTLVDGATGVGILGDLLDLTPDAPSERDEGDGREERDGPGEPAAPEPERPAVVPTPTEAALDAAAHRLSDPLRPLRAAMRAGSSLLRAADAVVTGRGAGEDHAAPFAAPRTRINASLTPRRQVTFGTTALATAKDLRRAFGVTVNDVVLAAVAGGLRRFLQEHDELPDRPLVASVPVSVHDRGGDRDSANQVSNMFVHLPVQLADPVERLRAVQRSASGAKALQGAMGPEMLGDMIDLVPPPLLSAAMSLVTRTGVADLAPPAHNLIVSNVPGPDVPLYLAGARVVGLYPFGPLIEGSGLNVTVLSHDGRLDVGLIACPDLVPGLDELLEGILSSFDELAALAGGGD